MALKKYTRLKYLVSINTEHAVSNEGYVGLENVESWSGRKIETNTPEAEGVALSYQKGDVLFGKLRPYLAKCYVAEEDACCSMEFLVMRPKKVVSKYLQYRILSAEFIDKVNMSTYGAKMPRANWSFIGNLKLDVPSMEEQQLIANYLDDRCSKIDAIIAEAKSSIEEYKELKESVIYKATNYAKNGELYKKIQLRLICEVHGRIGFKGYTSADQVAEGEGALSFGATHLQNGKVVMNNPVYISWDKYYESPEIMVKKGDILLVQRGSTIGKVAIVDEEFGEATINPSLVLLNNIDINNKFLLYALLSLDVQQKVAMIGSTTAIPMISQAQVKALKIPMPSENEMVSVVCYLDEKISKIDDMISEKQSLIEDLEAYKKSLIYEVVTGKRKVVA